MGRHVALSRLLDFDHQAQFELLGLSIWRSWPISGLWVIGLFIGIDLIVDGWTEVMLAVMARPLPV